jgi:hypothetical protein
MSRPLNFPDVTRDLPIRVRYADATQKTIAYNLDDAPTLIVDQNGTLVSFSSRVYRTSKIIVFRIVYPRKVVIPYRSHLPSRP